jgi:mono/diheme cytochrome c family protein
LLESLAGSDSFERYCASCHGPAGRGDGPTAPVLRGAPTDLTQLAQRNQGMYPAERVRAVITGYSSPLAAHGGTDMPVWGPIFKALDPSDLRVAARVENLVAFIERLQQPGATTGSIGAALFATHCATCHGREGRGGGIMTGELRHTPPDLTRVARRNGGVFPRARVLRIIDGRDVTAHGDRDMPVWGDAFSRTRQGLTEAEIKARLDSIVQYLEAIQERAAE